MTTPKGRELSRTDRDALRVLAALIEQGSSEPVQHAGTMQVMVNLPMIPVTIRDQIVTALRSAAGRTDVRGMRVRVARKFIAENPDASKIEVARVTLEELHATAPWSGMQFPEPTDDAVRALAKELTPNKATRQGKPRK